MIIVCALYIMCVIKINLAYFLVPLLNNYISGNKPQKSICRQLIFPSFGGAGVG